MLDFENVNPMAVVMAIAGGIIAVIVTKGSGTGFVWKLITFVVGAIGSFIVANIIANK